MDKAIIVCDSLTLGYENHPIVENMCFQIHTTEFVGILGPNGSGKSTFLKTILGLLTPLSGSITVMDKQPRHGNPEIGYMPQARNYQHIYNLSGFAILAATMNGTSYGIPWVSRSQKYAILQMVDLVQATNFIERPLHRLSGGERQRIYLAQAILGNPKILLLDEPLAGLDPKAQDVFVHVLTDIKTQMGTTILFTAHDPNPILSVIDKVLYFANKQAILGSLAEVITSERLSALYGTPIDVLEFNNRLIVVGESNHFEGLNHHHD